tara:strand:+ start:5610 stop:5822 length:213 start_codon:yes stop_codon:yes gene_type:complete
MVLKIEITNEPKNLRIFENITLDGFKNIIKHNPDMIIKIIEEMEEKLKPKGSAVNNKIEHTPFVCYGIVE